VSTIEDTDLFVVQQGGVHHQAAASRLSGLQVSDLLVAQRGGTHHQVGGDRLAALAPDDLLVAQRGGTHYSVRGEDLSSYLGGGGPWTPANLSNLLMFTGTHDLSGLVLLDGRVVEMADASGSPFVQADVNAQPSLTEQGVDRSVVVSNTRYLDSDVALDSHAQLSFFWLATNQLNAISWGGTADANNTIQAESSSFGPLTISVRSGGVTSAWQANGFGAFSNTLVVATLDNAANSRRGWRWGTELTPLFGSSGVAASAAFQGFSLGRPVWLSRTTPTELRFFGMTSSILGIPDIQRIEGWAAHTFDMIDQLPTDHPYKNEPPTR
jgi:hypothetical protein